VLALFAVLFYLEIMMKIDVGTIGHVDHSKTTITAALMLALYQNKNDHTDFCITKITNNEDPCPTFCVDGRKSKGEKRRERSERRRKWGI
jgi:translation initiation factor 2 gamma subunit (eIF-2gamma)